MKTYDGAPEILLVEDNPNDVELLLRAFKKNHITNRVNVVSDGEGLMVNEPPLFD